MSGLLRIHPRDNVLVATRAVPAGQEAAGIPCLQDIPAGHKLAAAFIPQGGKVIKYGYPIGEAIRDIAPGEWVHSHNLRTLLSGALEYTYQPDFRELPPLPPGQFLGFRREEGGVGIRNEVWIVPTVGCVNAIATSLAAQARGLLERYPQVEGITAFTHPYGCSQLGDDHLYTQKALSGLIRHPNAGAVLVLGLGCENNHIGELQTALGPVDPRRVKFLSCQDVGDEEEAALPLLEELCAYADGFRREPLPADRLVLGMKCGGSDGFSGVTANPLLGLLANRLAAEGGSILLTEVPEMFGAETILMNRCRTPALFRRTVELINGFKEYFLSHNQPVGENPSPGNREGGITTLEEKSLGCVQKGGDVPVSGVLGYGEPVEEPGLSLVWGPGNDLVSAAALAVSGAHIVLFSTGRGTPFASPVPTLKLSSNSGLADRKPHWIDFDAGRSLGGGDASSPEELAEELYQLVLDTASGRVRAKSEALDKSGFAIFKDGVTL